MVYYFINVNFEFKEFFAKFSERNKTAFPYFMDIFLVKTRKFLKIILTMCNYAMPR